MTKNCGNWNSFFLNFFPFIVFFLFFRQVLVPITTCLVFCELLDNLLAERKISWVLYPFVILENSLNFFSFLVQVVFKSFFHNLAASIF